MPEKKAFDKNFAILLNRQIIHDTPTLTQDGAVALADDEGQPSIDFALLGIGIDSGDVPNFDEERFVNNFVLETGNELNAEIDPDLHAFANNLKRVLRDKFGFNVDVDILKNNYSVSSEELYNIFVHLQLLTEVSFEMVKKCIDEALKVTRFDSEVSFVQVTKWVRAHLG